MSYELYKLAWAFPADEASEKIVLVYFADKASADGSNIYPALKTVARHGAISLRSVQRAIKSLEAKGVIVQTTPPRRKRRKPAIYRLDLAKMREIIAASDARNEAKTAPEDAERDFSDAAENSETKKPENAGEIGEVSRQHVVFKNDTMSSEVKSQNDTMSSDEVVKRHHVANCATPCHPNLHRTLPKKDNPHGGFASLTLAREGENPGSEFLIERDSPSGKIAEAEPSQGAFRKAETESGGKPTQVPRSGKITKRPREPVQGDLIPAPKAAHPSDASLPAELIEPFGEFYEIFPFARDRGAARDAFRWAAVIARAKPSELIEGARRYADERAQDRRDPATVRQFTRTPAKWLRAEGWTNASAPTSAPRANGFDHAAAAKRSLAESAAIALAMFPEPQGDDFTHGQILDLKAEQ